MGLFCPALPLPFTPFLACFSYAFLSFLFFRALFFNGTLNPSSPITCRLFALVAAVMLSASVPFFFSCFLDSWGFFCCHHLFSPAPLSPASCSVTSCFACCRFTPLRAFPASAPVSISPRLACFGLLSLACLLLACSVWIILAMARGPILAHIPLYPRLHLLFLTLLPSRFGSFGFYGSVFLASAVLVFRAALAHLVGLLFFCHPRSLGLCRLLCPWVMMLLFACGHLSLASRCFVPVLMLPAFHLLIRLLPDHWIPLSPLYDAEALSVFTRTLIVSFSQFVSFFCPPPSLPPFVPHPLWTLLGHRGLCWFPWSSRCGGLHCFGSSFTASSYGLPILWGQLPSPPRAPPACPYRLDLPTFASSCVGRPTPFVDAHSLGMLPSRCLPIPPTCCYPVLRGPAAPHSGFITPLVMHFAHRWSAFGRPLPPGQLFPCRFGFGL